MASTGRAPRRLGTFGRIVLALVSLSLTATACEFVLVDALWGALPGRVGAPDNTIVIEAVPADVEPPARIVVLGDVGTGDANEWATANLVVGAAGDAGFDGLVLLGDNVYPNGDPDRLDATVFDPFAPILDQGAALLPVLGNHDVEDGHALEQVAALGMPGRWYAAEVGPALVVGLDSTLVDDPDQLAWLEATLVSATSEWVIVTMHHPAYSAGYHGSTEEIQQTWVPLFARYGVDLVLAGHDHDYQRSTLIEGVTYIVSGAGAKTRPTARADFTAYAASVRHYLDVTIWEDRLGVTAYSAAGPFDHVTLEAVD